MMLKPNLDLLRAVAVLLVLAAHTIGYASGTTAVSYAMGQLGVMLFFVHTSLVLMQSLERQQVDGAALFRKFYIQRAFRIYPLAIVLLVGIYLLDDQWTRFEFIVNLLLVQNLFYARDMSDVLWSLPVEVQMYLMLPVLFVCFRHRPVKYLLLLWLVSVPVAYYVPTLVSARLNVFKFAPCFLAGVIAWRLQGRERLPGWMWPLLLALACLAFILYGEPRSNNYGRWLVCLAVGLAIPWLHQLALPWLNRASKTVAQYSYGIYLFHYPILHFAFRTLEGMHPVLQWGLAGSLIVLLPYLGYHLVEHPMVKLGVAVSQRSTAKKVAATAA